MLRVLCGIVVVAGVSALVATRGGARITGPLPAAGTVVASISVQGSPLGLLVTPTGVWVSEHELSDIVRVDPGSDEVTAHTTVLPKPTGQPGRMLAVGPNVFDVNYSGHTVSVVNAATHRLRRTFQTPFENCCWPVLAGGSLWLLGFSSSAADNPNRLMQVNPTTGRTRFKVSLPDVQGLVVADGALWGIELEKHRVFRFDIDTKRITATIPVAAQPFTFAFGSVWAVGGADVVRIDPATNMVDATIPLPADGAELTASDDAIWVDEGPLDSSGSHLWKIDPTTNTVVGQVTIPGVPSSLADIATAPDGSIWLSAFDTDRVIRVKPS
jgi:DNA-binding beta-propeller fold protein YncE